jgi:uncharacterized protein (DUF1015 family)
MASTPNPLLQPFSAERYARRELSDVLAPPYDVISPSQRDVLARKSAHNIVHLILPEGNGDRYQHAASVQAVWRKEHVLTRDATPSVYVVTQRTQGSDGKALVRTGMLAAVAVEPYSAGRVKPHEKTHAGPKADRLALLRALHGTFEAIFLIAPDAAGRARAALARVTSAPASAEGAVDGVAVRLWCVGGPDAVALTGTVEGAPLYIADGHHRYETTLAYQQDNRAATRTVALVVPASDPGLTVLATHRVVRGSALEVAEFRQQLDRWFVVQDLDAGADPARVLRDLGRAGTASIIALPGHVLSAVLRPDVTPSLASELPDPTVRALDVARVDHLIVGPLLRNNARTLDYTPDAGAALAAVAGGAAAAVLLNPTTVEQVFAVADARGVMPQKSTFFVPKVPSGLVGLSYDA